MAGKKKKESIGEYVDIDSLVEWEHNPRINTEAVSKVARSIERFGFASPIIAREEDSMVIAGHTRIAAARTLGLKTVPVRFMKLDRTEAELLAIADNKIGEISYWDNEKLDELVSSLETQDLSDIGFSDLEIDVLLEDVASYDDLDMEDFSEEENVQNEEEKKDSPQQVIIWFTQDQASLYKLIMKDLSTRMEDMSAAEIVLKVLENEHNKS